MIRPRTRSGAAAGDPHDLVGVDAGGAVLERLDARRRPRGRARRGRARGRRSPPARSTCRRGRRRGSGASAPRRRSRSAGRAASRRRLRSSVGVGLVGERPQPRRVGLGEVDEPGPDQRRRPGQVEVVGSTTPVPGGQSGRIAPLALVSSAARHRPPPPPARRGRRGPGRDPRRGGYGPRTTSTREVAASPAAGSTGSGRRDPAPRACRKPGSSATPARRPPRPVRRPRPPSPEPRTTRASCRATPVRSASRGRRRRAAITVPAHPASRDRHSAVARRSAAASRVPLDGIAGQVRALPGSR